MPDSISPVPRWQAVGSWLGVLLMLVFFLNTAGGWVRLSGSGVAIPHWPIIDLGTHKTVLPPWNEQEWKAAQDAWATHQEALRERVVQGTLHASNLGRTPRDQAEFKEIFLTEWGHRLLAAVTGLVALGLLVTVLRDGPLRRAIGIPYGAACGLILFQAVLGGLLVDEGTNTPHLWAHQGNAGMIMCCLLWSLLTVLALRPTPVPGRGLLLIGAAVVVILTWWQLVAGALVSGSKGVEGGYISRDLMAFGNLWQSDRGVGWNLSRNPGVAQWLHRWGAWLLVAVQVAYLVVLWCRPTGLRLRLVSQVLATFLGVQMLLGIASSTIGAQPLLILAHQAMGMCLLMSVMLMFFDLRYEPAVAAESDRSVANV